MNAMQQQDKQQAAKTGLILISGFLGAGKTTLLKHILSWKRDMSDTVVIVNEFGDIGIDGALLRGETSEIIELTSGCICCTLVLDLTTTLQKIWQRTHPRWIIVEASGLADPKAVMAAFQTDEVRTKIGFLKTVTVLDAEIWQMREVMGQIFYHQLETADLVLLNKTDRLDKRQVGQVINEVREFLPESGIIPTDHCRIDPESLLRSINIKQWVLDSHVHDHDGDSDFVTFSFSESIPMDKALFEQFIKDLPKDIFRVKGTVSFGKDTVFLNFVGGRADWSTWPEKEATRLVFIGWHSDPQLTLNRLQACISKS